MRTAGPKYGDYPYYDLLLRPFIYGSGRFLCVIIFEKFRGIPSTASSKMAGKFNLELVYFRKALFRLDNRIIHVFHI